MTITVHHLGISQSERIVWLMEELGLEYKLEIHTRDPLLSPDSLKSVPGNKTGKSPFISDSETGVTLSESGAICEYIVNTYANGQLSIPPPARALAGAAPDTTAATKYADYLYWLHYANGTLQAEMVTNMFLGATSDPPETTMIKQFARSRMDAAWQLLDDRLKESKWLAGDEFTICDVMSVYPPTTQRYWGPQDDLSKYTNLLRWLKDCTDRPAYKRAMEKGDPEMRIMNEGLPPKTSMMEVGGVVNSEHWKK